MTDPFAEIDAFWEKPFDVCPDDSPRQMRELVRYATLAPSAHNSQPWSFDIGDREIRIFPDFSRRCPVADPGDRQLWLSLGCALEHLSVAALRVGYAPAVDYFPGDEPEECLRVRFARTEPDGGSPLFSAIAKRHMNRRPYDGKPIPAKDLRALEQAVSEEGVLVRIITDEFDFERVVELVKTGLAWRRNNKAFLAELRSWIRSSVALTVEKRDGFTSRANGKPFINDRLGRFIARLRWALGIEDKELVAGIRSSSALLFLLTEENDRITWVRAGRSLARIKLTATDRDIRCAHLDNNWQWDVMKAATQQELSLGSAHPQVALRLGYAETLPHAPRRPLEAVLRRAKRKALDATLVGAPPP
jgi:hypothetical protein